MGLNPLQARSTLESRNLHPNLCDHYHYVNGVPGSQVPNWLSKTVQIRLELAPSPWTLSLGLLVASLLQVGPYTREIPFAHHCQPIYSIFSPCHGFNVPVTVVMTLTPRTVASLLAYCLMIKAKWKQRGWRQPCPYQQLLSSEGFLPIRKRLLWQPDFPILIYSNPFLINFNYNSMSFLSWDKFQEPCLRPALWHQLAFS